MIFRRAKVFVARGGNERGILVRSKSKEDAGSGRRKPVGHGIHGVAKRKIAIKKRFEHARTRVEINRAKSDLSFAGGCGSVPVNGSKACGASGQDNIAEKEGDHKQALDRKARGGPNGEDCLNR